MSENTETLVEVPEEEKSPQERISTIRERIATREAKIENVQETKIAPRKELIARIKNNIDRLRSEAENRQVYSAHIQKNIDKFQGHIDRWRRANENDKLKIELIEQGELDTPKDKSMGEGGSGVDNQ